MLYQAQGKVHEKFDTEEISDRFRKREFVLKIVDGNFEQFIKFQLTQNKCELLDPINSGQDVEVTFALQGRPFTNKEGKTIYFTNLNAINIKAGEGTSFNQTENQDFDPNVDVPPPNDSPLPEDDDLPF